MGLQPWILILEKLEKNGTIWIPVVDSDGYSGLDIGIDIDIGIVGWL